MWLSNSSERCEIEIVPDKSAFIVLQHRKKGKQLILKCFFLFLYFSHCTGKIARLNIFPLLATTLGDAKKFERYFYYKKDYAAVSCIVITYNFLQYDYIIETVEILSYYHILLYAQAKWIFVYK